MAIHTDIEWCDSTLNLEMGCDGCELWNPKAGVTQCYAGRETNRRKGGKGWPEAFDRPRVFMERLPAALKWPDLTGQPRPGKPWLDGLPRLVFLNDMGDTFTESLPEDWLAPALGPMAASPHQWLVLTKRPGRMARFFGRQGVPGNFWLGTSVAGEANVGRVADLVRIRGAKVLFVSAEPLLGEVSLRRWLGKLQWVIAGGESLAGSRPSHPDWFRKVRDECAGQGVPFFFKQWGDFAPLSQVPATALVTERLLRDLPWHEFPPRSAEKEGQLVYRIGNDAAGASLDGREWREVPGQ
jgi:protein gp37